MSSNSHKLYLEQVLTLIYETNNEKKFLFFISYFDIVLYLYPTMAKHWDIVFYFF